MRACLSKKLKLIADIFYRSRRLVTLAPLGTSSRFQGSTENDPATAQ